jgi:hypothetical protein
MHDANTGFSPERYHPRVDANFMLKVMAGGRLLIAKAKDLSMAGVFVLGLGGRPGDLLTLSVPLPNDREVVTSARILRVREDGAAVEFDQLDWDDLCALARYLHPRLP